jgi:small subunit ribosomal protein S21
VTFRRIAAGIPSIQHAAFNQQGVTDLQVFVRDNNVDQALRILKKKMQREGVFREMKRRRFYEKPSDKATREKADAIRRRRKLARKQAVRDGLIAAPAKPRVEIRKRPPALPTVPVRAG